jgi:hypothetical protein
LNIYTIDLFSTFVSGQIAAVLTHPFDYLKTLQISNPEKYFNQSGAQ